MSESPAVFQQSELMVSGPDPLRLAQSLVATLATLTGDPDRWRDDADAAATPASIAPFQAEGSSVPNLARGIVDDVMATIADSTTGVADIELANVLRTDEGWRAWGYVRFGAKPRRQTPPGIVVEPSEAGAEGQITFRLLVTPGPSASTGANGASSGASNGMGR